MNTRSASNGGVASRKGACQCVTYIRCSCIHTVNSSDTSRILNPTPDVACISNTHRSSALLSHPFRYTSLPPGLLSRLRQLACHRTMLANLSVLPASSFVAFSGCLLTIHALYEFCVTPAFPIGGSVIQRERSRGIRIWLGSGIGMRSLMSLGQRWPTYCIAYANFVHGRIRMHTTQGDL